MIRELIKGFQVTLRYMFRRGITIEYPEKKREVSEAYRGIPALRKYPDDGRERCVACCLCVQICPARCIHMITEEDAEGKKRPVAYEIDIGRCLYCGLCAEVCPEEALILSRRYELVCHHQEETVQDKETLLRRGEGL